MTKQDFITEFMAHNVVIVLEPGKGLQAQLEQYYTIAESVYNTISAKTSTQSPQRPIEVCYDNVLKSELHSAHKKIKRQRKSIKRKAKAYVQLTNDFHEYMRNSSEAIAKATECMEKAEAKADRMQWIAEHVDEEVKQRMAKTKADYEYKYNGLQLTYATNIGQAKRTYNKRVTAFRNTLTGMIDYLGDVNLVCGDDVSKHIAECINRMNESIKTLDEIK